MSQPTQPTQPTQRHRADICDSDLLLLQNKAWAQAMVGRDARYFARLSDTQSPKFLWIGCADSRVAADTITGTQPGQLFVHRNIANVVVHTDLNLLSVLAYAVEVLEVEHVIVCGHHGCGGVKAAMTQRDYGLLNKWLLNIKEVYAHHIEELEAVPAGKPREDRLCELNAVSQLQNLAKTLIIQKAWNERGGPFLHAWVYDLGDGVLHQLDSLGPDHQVASPFRLDMPEEG